VVDNPGLMASLTTNLTAAVCVPETVVIEIVPVHTVPALSPDGSTATLKFVPAVPVVKRPLGVSPSQLLPAQLWAVALAVTLTSADAVTFNVWDAGGPPPALAVKAKLEGFSLSVTGALTFRMTGVPQTPVALLMLTVPEQNVPAVNPAALTVTVNDVAFKFAVNGSVGDTASHVVPVQVVSETFTVALVSKGAVTVSVWEGVSATPVMASKVIDEGFTVNAPVGTRITVRVTGINLLVEPAVIVTVPLQVAPTAMPEWATDTVKTLATELTVKLAVGDTLSHCVSVQLCCDT